MRLKRVIKKIAALSAGATMVGATMLGAMAADLGDYPSPLFIKDGKFIGILVVGDKADAKDIIGITDVMGSLQYAATKSITTGTTTIATISEGVKIDKSSSHLNFGESFYDIEPTGLDVDDLPDILADGTFDESEGANKNDIDYEQELKFSPNTITLTFTQDDDDAPVAGDYLILEKTSGEYAYTYELDFDDDLEYDNSSEYEAKDDLETATLVMQGNTYTITDVKLTNGKIKKLYLQAGETSVWLEEGVTLMRSIGDIEHEIVLIDVSEQAEKCGISIDGVTQWIDVGSSKTISGVEVGVTDAITIHSATQDTDTCQVNLGAVEIMLENNNEIEVGGEDLDGSETTITDAGGLLSKITISYTPEDKVYIPVGGSWIDPVFGNFEYNYAGLSMSTETIELTASSDDAELELDNNDGRELEIPFHYIVGTTTMIMGTGDDLDEVFIVEDSSIPTGGDVTNVEGAQLLKVLGNGEAHIIEINDIDVNDFKVTIKDVTYGGEKTSTYEENVSTVIELPEGLINLTITPTTLDVAVLNEFIGSGSNTPGHFETKNEAQIGLSATRVVLYENPDGSNDDGDSDNQIAIGINVTYDDGDEEIHIGRPNVTGWEDVSDTNNDDRLAATYFGTHLEYDDENNRDLVIKYPMDEAYGNAFVSKVGADVTTTAAAGESVVIQRIEVGATKLASEVADVKAQNSILVGGPCANAATAEALGNPADCAAGFEEGKGLIQLVEFANGKVAMIVAGYSADDTRNAATVVANYKDYALRGTKVEISKVGTQYTVTA